MVYWEATENVTVNFLTTAAEIEQRLRQILAGRLINRQKGVVISCQIELTSGVVLPPAEPAEFVDQRLGPPTTFGNVTVHGSLSDLSRLTIYFNQAAAARFSFHDGGAECHLVVSAHIFGTGKLEDVVFTSLAPLLRREKLIMVHAFAAVNPAADRALMLVGRSESGKTTTGLNLLLNGWQLLGNDIVLLTPHQGEVWGLPTPGLVTIRPPTFDLLPDLKRFKASRDIDLNSDQLNVWAEPTRLTAIYFPHVKEQAHTERRPISQALALARLMEESVDLWDKSVVEDHIKFLAQLIQKTQTFQLELGQDMSQLLKVV